MVYLTITAAIVEALEALQSLEAPSNEESQSQPTAEKPVQSETETIDEKYGERREEATGRPVEPKGSEKTAEPSLSNPELGNPISHGQIIDLSKAMKAKGLQPCQLETLLKGSKVYIPPPPPKAEPTSEYKALMTRLRREAESRTYSRMLNPPPPLETFSQRFPSTSAAHAFSSNHLLPENIEDDLTYADVDRQMALILNVLVSIVACAGAIWVVARWWSIPARLALSMSGSLLVGVAEVVVYSGYIRRVGEAKKVERGVREVKEVVRTWVVGAGQEGEEKVGAGDVELIKEKERDELGTTRLRVGKFAG